MDNPGLPPTLWVALDGRLWHATGREGFEGIVRDQEIRVFRDRYAKSLCKMLDGVSLMDFGPTATDNSNQFINWRGWFGHYQGSRVAVWLEIERRAVTQALRDAAASRAIWHDKGCPQFIPGVEACHDGPIPFASVNGILLIDREHHEVFERLEIENATGQALAEFERRLAALPPESELTTKIQAARERLRAPTNRIITR